MDATYSPEDNKLRLYAEGRLDDETYRRVRAAGFRWAPRQELFVAPAWTPEREDLLIELCGAIGDEDTGLLERTEDRAERFDQYSQNRARDAEAAEAAVHAIADGIPLGQPILVGHHSEKRARRDAKRIDAGMRRAVRAWETSAYWTERARAAIAAAKYRLRPEVRARRIRKLEADRRRLERSYTPDPRQRPILQERWYCPECHAYACKEHPSARVPVPHVWCGRGGSWVPEADLPAIEARCRRPIAHLDRRLEYERAMLEAEGKSGLLERPKRPKPPPLLNYRAQEPLRSENEYHPGEYGTYPQVECTKARYARVPSDHRGTRLAADRSHRFRIARARSLGVHVEHGAWSYVAVFLTDSKAHPQPEAGEDRTAPPRELAPTVQAERPGSEARERAAQLRQSGTASIAVVPSLVETPPDLVRRMLDLANLEPGGTVLEPSAGMGAIARAIVERGCVAFCLEVDDRLRERLRDQGYIIGHPGDFMAFGIRQFDRIVMNPPFERGQDAAHLRHAYNLLTPGGRVVAIVSAGPFFRERAEDRAFRDWFGAVKGRRAKLPEETFKPSGCTVSTWIVVIDKPEVMP